MQHFNWCTTLDYTASPLQTNLQVADFQRCQRLFHRCQARCWGSFSSTASRVPSLLQAVRLRACSLDACPWMSAGALYYCTFCTLRLRKFSLFFIFVIMSYGSTGKKPTCNAGDLGSIPGLGRSTEEEKGYPLQYSGLENSMGSQGVRHDWTTFTFTFYLYEKY